MSSWHSYPSIFNMGHKAIQNLLNHDVNVEEKVDGSQFSFGLVEPSEVDATFEDTGLALKIRSKGAVMHIDAPEKMFAKAGETVRELASKGLLHPGWTYRGEYLAKPKHNALTYDRVPQSPCGCDPIVRVGCSICAGTGKKSSHVILFDINTGDQEFLSYEDKKAEADRLGLETVPLLYSGRIDNVGQFRDFLETTSVLGGQKIEGVVVKPREYNLFGLDKKVLMGKFVSEAFKEVHRKSWGESNPTNKDIIGLLVSTLATPARWQKALIHLREAGKIEDSVRDIGTIIKEVPGDVLKEEEDFIKEQLFKHAWPHIRRGLTSGVPMWYKDQLLRRQFELEAKDETTDSGLI